MTSVLTRPPSEPTTTARRPLSTRHERPGADASEASVAAAAAVTLAAVTATAAMALGRLFTTGSFVAPVLIAVAATHAVAIACRRLGLGFAPTLLASLVGLAATIVWVVEPHTTTYGLPTGTTFHAIGHDLTTAWNKFGQVVAPTPVSRGFVLSAVLGVWAAGLAADSAAFRLGAPFEAAIPSFTLFIFGAVLGADRHRVGYTVAYLAALLLFLLVHGSLRRSERMSWFAGRNRGGARALVQGGIGLVVVAVAAALLLGPGLPGAKSSALVSWRPERDNGPSARTTVSPLVDIRTRLVDQSNRDVFSVQSSAAAYWRLTSLDRFDGQIWSSVGTYRPASDRLPEAVVNNATRTVAVENFSISNLASIWLPAAYEPQRLSNVKHVRYDADSSSLLAEADTSDGLQYRVTSGIPIMTEAQLNAVKPVAPRDISKRYLALPADFPQSVVQLAQRVATGSTPYEKARSLQDFLRANYTYDLRVPPGHDIPAIERFLFQTKRGYCEQFAGSYAAMARAVGLPARVAVGFTPGDVEGPNLYRVRGKDAHAWPEVYLDGYGWVAFEPTPGRGIPGAQSYTGVAAPNPTDDNATTPTTAPPAAAPVTPTTTTPPTTLPPAQRHHHRSSLVSALLWALLAVVIVAALAAVVPLATVVRRRRRRAAATSPDARVLLAWTEAVERLGVAGHPKHAWETTAEFASRVAPQAPGAAEPLAELADDAAAVSFSGAATPLEAASRAERAAARVEAEVAATASPWQRLRWSLDPRPLLRPSSA